MVPLLGNFDLTGIPPAPRGVPQIDVEFDQDANCILNVSAVDKSTRRSNKVTITNDNAWLSKAEIDQMVSEAEKYQKEDENNRECVQSKNQLQNYVYGVRNAVEEDKGKLQPSEKTEALNACEEALKWLDLNAEAEKSEFEGKLKMVQESCNPIMTKLHGDRKYECTPGGPKVEEVT